MELRRSSKEGLSFRNGWPAGVRAHSVKRGRLVLSSGFDQQTRDRYESPRRYRLGLRIGVLEPRRYSAIGVHSGGVQEIDAISQIYVLLFRAAGRAY
jgi:hypothetical protein